MVQKLVSAVNDLVENLRDESKDALLVHLRKLASFSAQLAASIKEFIADSRGLFSVFVFNGRDYAKRISEEKEELLQFFLSLTSPYSAAR